MSDLLKRVDPKGDLRKTYAWWLCALGYVDPHTGFERLLDFFSEHGLLRDPDEPTIAEIRETIKTLRSGWVAAPSGITFSDGREYRSWVGDAHVLVRSDVLALLEPKKPEPVYRRGDWVVRRASESSGPHLVIKADVNSRVWLNVDDGWGWWPREELRYATAEEIAKARGEPE